MAPHITHLTQADYQISQWSGGTTTQIAIAPQGALYADRDFLWRLSSATVDLDESDFTPLPDYHRLIAPLRGEMELTHDGGPLISLAPYQVHAFDGGADTHSRGRCVDFNLMTVDGYRGAMSACAAGGESAEIAPEGASEYWRGIYSLTDGLTVKCAAGGEEGEYKLDKGDFLLFSYSPAQEGTARVSLRSACGGAPAVCAEVWR